MKIRKISCEQFAGMKNQSASFSDGLNLLIGKNESGKSTLLDLLYQMLFKDVKIDGRSDKDFKPKYFPRTIGGLQADFIDGEIVFETDEGEYKLQKEWNDEGGSIKLISPDGTAVKRKSSIDAFLNQILTYREGVYSEIVFASQRRTQHALASLFPSGKTEKEIQAAKEDFSSTLVKATMETGGVSLDKIEKTINDTINDLGARWDLEANAPEGGRARASYQNAWKVSSEKDSIVMAYYALDEAKQKQKHAEEIEEKIEECNADIKRANVAITELQKEYDNFQKNSGLIVQKRLLAKDILTSEALLREQKSALENWPKVEADLARATKLRDMQIQAETAVLLAKVEKQHQEYEEAAAKLAAAKDVEKADIDAFKKHQKSKIQNENKLLGMHLTAKVKKLSDTPVEIRSEVSGEILPEEQGQVEISEAVNITVPGIMEMQLAPAGVDVTAIKETMSADEKAMQAILGKYGAKDLEGLENLKAEFTDVKAKCDAAKTKFESALGEHTWEDLLKQKAALPEELPELSKVREEIAALCKGKSVDGFIGACETARDGYVKKYEDTKKLAESAATLEKEIAANQTKLASLGVVPKEYENITDGDAYLAKKKNLIEIEQGELEAQQKDLRDAEIALGNDSSEEYADAVAELSEKLASRIATYRHWLHIRDVFQQKKAESDYVSVDDIETKFKEYLAVLSDGGIALRAIDEKMSAKIASGNADLSYDILSDGTKDTISLAFRLAMLEHLYPDGGGLAVFDDPFTDMDPQRVARACALVAKFAEKNQVIFATCDEKYTKLLEGNVIPIA